MTDYYEELLKSAGVDTSKPLRFKHPEKLQRAMRSMNRRRKWAAFLRRFGIVIP